MFQSGSIHTRLAQISALKQRLWFVLLLSLAIGATGADAQSERQLSVEKVESLLQLARQLVAAGRMKLAYEVLSPHELQLAGDIDYDYYYGTAASDIGRYSAAIFALQRVVDQRKDFTGARLELARAYYGGGDSEQARFHFDKILEANPPPNVRGFVLNYKSAIDSAAGTFQAVHIPRLAVGVGYDGNANASTDVDEFLDFKLANDNLSTASSYTTITLADLYSTPITSNLRLELRGLLNSTYYPSADFVNARTANASIGVRWEGNQFSVTPTIAGSLHWLDSEKHLAITYADLGLGYAWSPHWRLVGGLRYSAADFRTELDQRDVGQVAIRVGVEHRPDGDAGALLSFHTHYSVDEPDDNNSSYKNERAGITFSGSRSISPVFLAGFDLAASRTDYADDRPFFGEDRVENLLQASASLHWFDFPARGWRTSSRLNYSKNHSSISLYTYDRAEIGVTFHRAFE